MVEELTPETFPRPPGRTGSGQERLRDDNLKDPPELPQRSRLMKKSELSIPPGGYGGIPRSPQRYTRVGQMLT